MADIAPQPFVNYGLSQAEQGQAQASAALQSQQAQQVGLQNQVTQAQLPIIMNAMKKYAQLQQQQAQQQQAQEQTNQDASGSAANANTQATGGPGTAFDNTGVSGGVKVGSDPWNAASIGAQLRQQYFVPVWTDQESQFLGPAVAAKAAGNDNLIQALGAQRQARYDQQSQVAMKNANQTYESYASVVDPNATADPITLLAGVDKGAAARIVAASPGDTDEQNARAARYADLVASTVHQYTGRKVVARQGDNVRVDEVTGMPVAGLQKPGITQDAFDKIMGDGLKPVQWTDSANSVHNGPAWTSPHANPWGATTLEDWANHVAARQNIPGTTPNSSIGQRQQAQSIAAASAAKVHAANPIAASPAPSATSGVAPVVSPVPPPTGQNGQPLPGSIYQAGTPAFNKRSQDALNAISAPGSEYANPAAIAAQHPVQNRGPTAIEQGQQKNYVAGVAKLQDAQSDVQEASSTALRNYAAADQILNARPGQPVTGLSNEVSQYIASKFPSWDSSSVADRVKIAKYLVQGAVSQLKPMYGSRPGVFDVKVNLERAFPNVDAMDEQGLRELVKSQYAAAQYGIDTANRVPGYIQRGGEPRYFHTWNQKFFPQEGVITELQSQERSGPPAGAETQSYQGKNYYLPQGADRSKQANWVSY